MMTKTISIGRERNWELINFYILVEKRYTTTEDNRHA